MNWNHLDLSYDANNVSTISLSSGQWHSNLGTFNNTATTTNKLDLDSANTAAVLHQTPALVAIHASGMII